MANTLMKAALRCSIHVNDHDEDGWVGGTWFYFDADGRHGQIAYEQRKGLKTKEAAIAKQRRETKQYLLDLRAQIDSVLDKIDTEPFNEEYDVIRVLSSAYKTD